MKSVHDMISYLDTEVERDTRYEVVSYLLAHLRDLDSLSLSEVARQTYVSKSTVSRVVRRFGFDSYDEFLAITRRLVGQDPSVTLRIAPDELRALRSGDESYIESYVDELCAALQDLKSTVRAETIDSLIEDMMTRETALFATEQPLMIARDVQVAFLAAGHLIHVGETGSKRQQIAQELPSGSLAIVLSNYGRYLEDNPRRLMLKTMNPAFFSVRHHLSINGRQCAAIGNLFLLDIPDKMEVVVHRRDSDDEYKDKVKVWMQCGENYGVLVGAFISEREQAVKQAVLEKGYTIIQLTNDGIGPCYKPSGNDFYYCATGRMLILSPWPDAPAKSRISRWECLQLNALAEIIAMGRFLKV